MEKFGKKIKSSCSVLKLGLLKLKLQQLTRIFFFLFREENTKYQNVKTDLSTFLIICNISSVFHQLKLFTNLKFLDM